MISRRAIAAGIVGVAGGGLGGVLVAMRARPEASIRFIGREDTIIALLDTTNERVLFFLGEPNERVLDHLPQLLTYGGTRVDLIAASHRWLTFAGIRDAIDLDSTQTLVLQSDSVLPPIAGNVHVVLDSMVIELSGGTEIRITVDRDDPNEPANPLIAVEIAIDGSRLLLANREPALELVFERQQLIAVPGDVSPEALHAFSPSIVVSTALLEDTIFENVLVYDSDPIALTLSSGTISTNRD